MGLRFRSKPHPAKDLTPGAPQNFQAYAASSTVFVLNWQEDPNKTLPDDFDLDYSTVSAVGPWTPIPINLAYTYNHTGQDVTVRHWWRLVAKHAGFGSVSVITSAIAYRPVFIVAPPSAVIPSTGDSIQFTATDIDGGALTYSLAFRYRSDITINPLTGLVTVPATAAGTNGNIIVRCTDSIGLFAETTCAVIVSSTLALSTLRAAGYILPQDYNPLAGDGVTDCTVAIQAAIDAAYLARKTVWFQSGTYIISSMLRCYRWQKNGLGGDPDETHQLVGASSPNRPVIKLAAGASGFNNFASPRPMIIYAQWKPDDEAAVGAIAPADLTSWHPYTTVPPPSAVGIWQSNTPNFFKQLFSNIDIDTNNNPGADGLFMATAQGAYLGDCKVTATGSVCGIRGLPGRDSNSRNLEVVGGRLGISTETFILSGCGGALVSGLKCTGQTIACVEAGDFIPLVIVGFQFSKNSNGSVFIGNPIGSSTCANAAIFVDGRVETASGVAFDNTLPVGLYLRNVYVGGGTTDLIKTGGTTLVGSGAWSRIDEYCANRMGGTFIAPGTPTTASTDLQHFELRNGVSTRVAIPEANKTNNVGAPPADLVSRHVYSGIPVLDSGPYINVTSAPYNAVATVGVDNRIAIQNAINAAEALGHNRVFIPKGTFEIGSPGLVLGANTKLFGTGIAKNRTMLYTHSSWPQVAGVTSPIISTSNTAAGTAFLGFLVVASRDSGAARTNFCSVKWMVGRNSATAALEIEADYVDPDILVSTTPTYRLWITGNGGGRHYGYYTDTIGLGGVDSRGLKITDTTNEPLHVYGANVECVKRAGEDITTGFMLTNIEVTNADNVRIYSLKREGNAPTAIINNSNNVALYGGGGMRSEPKNYNQVLGNSNNILMAQILVQKHEKVAGGYTVYENITGGGGVYSIGWPNGCSLYKRGILDDSAVGI